MDGGLCRSDSPDDRPAQPGATVAPVCLWSHPTLYGGYSPPLPLPGGQLLHGHVHHGHDGCHNIRDAGISLRKPVSRGVCGHWRRRCDGLSGDLPHLYLCPGNERHRRLRHDGVYHACDGPAVRLVRLGTQGGRSGTGRRRGWDELYRRGRPGPLADGARRGGGVAADLVRPGRDTDGHGRAVPDFPQRPPGGGCRSAAKSGVLAPGRLQKPPGLAYNLSGFLLGVVRGRVRDLLRRLPWRTRASAEA